MRKIPVLFFALTLLIGSYVPSYAKAQGAFYDTDVFGENARDIVENHFSETFLTTVNGEVNRRPSGWDVDYRGGKLTTQGYVLKLSDTSDTEKVSLEKEILKVSGKKVTFETALLFESAGKAKFSAKIFGDNGDVLDLCFDNGKIYNVSNGERTYLCDFASRKKIYIKSEISLDEKWASVLINNEIYNINLSDGADSITNISFSTGKSEKCAVLLYFVNIYQNFVLREKFMTAPEGSVPSGFTVLPSDTGSGIAYAPGSPYVDDKNGFLLKNDSGGASLKTSFENENKTTTVSYAMLIPEKSDGISAKFKGSSGDTKIYTQNGDLYFEDTLLKSDYLPNLWYKFSIEFDAENNKANIFVNYKKYVVPYNGGVIKGLEFSKSEKNSTVMLDDIEVYKTYEKYPDYPTGPEATEKQDSDISVGMVMYSMWREGTHFGWDTISPYADERKPLIGYYTEGQREVADWQNKFLTEHGADYEIYPFVRPKSNGGEAVKNGVRSEDLNDGYLNSAYSSDIKFAIMVSAFSNENYTDADEFIKNVLPYLSEYYFSDERYMKINGKMPVFCFSFVQIADTLGGAGEIKKIVAALDSEAKKLGFSGVMFCADAANVKGRSYVNSVGSDAVYVWNYGYLSGNLDYLKSKTDEQYSQGKYIASVCMGYDDEPWRNSASNMMQPSEVKDYLNYIKDHSGFKNSDNKTVVLTCWNEYGEGHFYSPSTIGGFGYLNVVREVFTKNGEKTDEVLPSDAAKARMEVFYPNGRGALKTLPEKSVYTLNGVNPIYTLENSLPDGKYGCDAELSDGLLECTATAADPQLYFDKNTEIDISDVKEVKIRAYTYGGSGITLFYKTTDNPAYGQGKKFETTKMSGAAGYSEYVLKPADLGESPVPTGKITGIRIDPDDDLYEKGAKFGIEWIKFYGADNADNDIILKIDGKTADITSKITEKNGTLYVPIYSVLLKNMGAYTLWNEPSKTLTAYRNRNSISITADNADIIQNGAVKTWNNAPYYEKGNIFVPYDEFFSSFGCVAAYDGTAKEISVLMRAANEYGICAVDDTYTENIASELTEDNENDFGSSSVLSNKLIFENFDGKNVVKIVPSDPSKQALFLVRYVNYEDERRLLRDVISLGGKMRVSFLYKGNCGGLRVENRKADKIDGETVYKDDVNENAWKTFSYEFDNSLVSVEDGDMCWIAVRLLPEGVNSPYLYISDLKIECFEETETNVYRGDTVRLKINVPSRSAFNENYFCVAAEYDPSGNLTKIECVKNGNAGGFNVNTEYLTYKSGGGATIKFFILNDYLTPLCNMKRVDIE